jgi:hypothetical protein
MNMKDQVRQPYITLGKILVLYVFMFRAEKTKPSTLKAIITSRVYKPTENKEMKTAEFQITPHTTRKTSANCNKDRVKNIIKL